MQTNKLSRLARMMVLVCSVLMVITLFVPIWRIDLDAPQYPEGLRLLIFANKLGGNVDIVNGLNHYIGMKTLHADDFAEFTVLPYLLGFFALLFLITAISGKKKMLVVSLVAFVAFGIIAMIDFWRWEYNYGHNLNPDAAIVVPGMTYQPPLIGFKQLLNFGAYSIPAIGGWLIVAAGCLLVAALFATRKPSLASKSQHPVAAGLLILAFTTFSTGCQTDPKPIRIGSDQCDYCKMTVMDLRFASELVTKKGKVYRFDDNHCLKSFVAEQTMNKEQIDAVYFADFSHEHGFIKSDQAFFLSSDALKTPMNGNIAAFADLASLNEAKAKFPGSVVNLADIIP